MRKKRQKWTYELLHKTGLIYNTRNDFKKGSLNAYKACQRRGILDEICSHMEGNIKWSDEKLFTEARKYNTRSEFQKGSKNAYKACQRRGILDAVCSHMEHVLTYWSDEMLFAEARKYNTRGSFQKESPSAYEACCSRGILNEVCGHMEYVFTYWTNEKLFAEAIKYKTRSEFFNESRNAYCACQRRGILNDACSHMEEPPHWDEPHCVYLIEIFTVTNKLYYYVGQTCNLEDRLNKHFHNKGSDSPVYDFLNKTPIKYKKHYIVKKNLSYKKSLELESDTIKNLKDRGFNLLNKVLYI